MTETTMDRTGVAWRESLPCPRCGQDKVIGYLMVTETGQHQHTHYVCTFYGAGQSKPCGWHGWTVPGWDSR